MVSTTHWLATAAGMRVLELGGNAFDAAVAAGFALQVAEPHLNGPGGDLPVLFWSSREGAPRVLCAQGVAPDAASVGRCRELGLDLVPGTGLLAACVPGAFDGWMLLLRDFGTMRLRDVLDLAIEFAEAGVPVLPGITDTIAQVEALFRGEWPTSAALWLTDGGVPSCGSLLRNRTLAATYRRIVREAEQASADRDAQLDAARRVFYEGFVAEAIDRYVPVTETMDSSGRRHAGWLTGADLASWTATYENPVMFDFRDVTVCKTGPWGQGPVFLQQLSILSRLDLEGLRLGSERYMHTIIEAAKLAFADREAWYGDPRFVDVPLDALLSPEYASARARLISDDASPDLRPGRPNGRVPHMASSIEAASAVGAGEPTFQSRQMGDTCHLDVVDRFGNVVSATPSGGWLQSSPAIPGLGFCLGTRAQMFWLDEEHPNGLAPGKRPRTTLSPSLALRGGMPYLAFGTPGGDQQDQWSLTFLLAHLLFERNLQSAIDEPTFHPFTSRRRSTPATATAAACMSRGARPGKPTRCVSEGMRSSWRQHGRSRACVPSRANATAASRGRQPAADAGVRGRPLIRRTCRRTAPDARSPACTQSAKATSEGTFASLSAATTTRGDSPTVPMHHISSTKAMLRICLASLTRVASLVSRLACWRRSTTRLRLPVGSTPCSPRVSTHSPIAGAVELYCVVAMVLTGVSSGSSDPSFSHMTIGSLLAASRSQRRFASYSSIRTSIPTFDLSCSPIICAIPLASTS